MNIRAFRQPTVAASIAGACVACLPLGASADAITNPVAPQAVNPIAIGMFAIFVVMSLGITVWAARRGTRSRASFYSADGGLNGWQNGLAIAGDYTSAATFLGVTALVYTSGYDGMIYAIGFLVGFPMILFLIAEPLRNLGRYTFADVLAYRLDEKPVRVFASASTLVIVLFYLIAQMVGAGKLIETLFGLPYAAAVGIVGVLMMLYVAFGGMLATSWVQLIKAILLLSGSLIMSFGIMWRFGFSLEGLFEEAVRLHARGRAVLAPGGLVHDPISAVSLGIALIFGTAGLPHILMRFFTVKNARQARTSVLVATGFISIFYSLLFILGFGAIALVSSDHRFHDGAGNLIGGANMVALHLADAIGGSLLLGFISAVAFATILAVVSGLTLAGAAAASHDFYAQVVRSGRASESEEVLVSKAATVALSLAAMGLGLLFEHQNIAFMVGLVFALSASANFPVILLSVMWPGLTTRGALAGGLTGLLTALTLVVVGPSVWTATLHLGRAPFPYENPALFSVPLAFAVCWCVSRLDRSAAATRVRAAFEGAACSGADWVGGRVDPSFTRRRSLMRTTIEPEQAPREIGLDWSADIRADFAANAHNPCVGTRLLSEDARVRVWEIRLRPGERIGFHRHVLDYFWTAVTPGCARSHNQGGPSVETVYAAGDTKHHVYGPGEYKVHDLENIGSTELVFTTVEFLQSANAPLSLPNGKPASARDSIALASNAYMCAADAKAAGDRRRKTKSIREDGVR